MAECVYCGSETGDAYDEHPGCARASLEEAVSVAAGQSALALDGLAAAMKDAHVAGASLRAIAKAAGMSHESVRRIVSTRD